MTAYTIERRISVWNDVGGDRVEVGPDGDGLDLVCITAKTSTGTEEGKVVLTRDMAREVCNVLAEYLDGRTE